MSAPEGATPAWLEALSALKARDGEQREQEAFLAPMIDPLGYHLAAIVMQWDRVRIFWTGVPQWTDVWEAVTVDYGDVSSMLDVPREKAVRLVEQGRKIGAIYPDGSRHPNAVAAARVLLGQMLKQWAREHRMTMRKEAGKA